MSELFEDDELILEDKDVVEVEKIELIEEPLVTMDARRRLEQLLEEKRLREELEDFLD